MLAHSGPQLGATDPEPGEEEQGEGEEGDEEEEEKEEEVNVLSSYPGPIIEEVGPELANAPASFFAVPKRGPLRRTRGKKSLAAVLGP